MRKSVSFFLWSLDRLENRWAFPGECGLRICPSNQYSMKMDLKFGWEGPDDLTYLISHRSYFNLLSVFAFHLVSLQANSLHSLKVQTLFFMKYGDSIFRSPFAREETQAPTENGILFPARGQTLHVIINVTIQQSRWTPVFLNSDLPTFLREPWWYFRDRSLLCALFPIYLPCMLQSYHKL